MFSGTTPALLGVTGPFISVSFWSFANSWSELINNPTVNRIEAHLI
ncbi:hypothetical protein C427_5538 [Paraglaciecola psychrophila 170]|uniref:Uncharacterized protein n=1 Tax=Paraglaciecola psychrophila 170 TaxID=1129794 RepID=M4SAD2_9ALTE|nr:hypothetical protein C427_5538 [Paraglaciecola psychrophila 170]